MQRALDRALETYAQFPTAFPSVAELNPNNFERWTLKTPERWVDPKTLETDAEGRVKIGGDAVLIWRYFTVIWAAATAPSSSSF